MVEDAIHMEDTTYLMIPVYNNHILSANAIARYRAEIFHFAKFISLYASNAHCIIGDMH